MASATDMKVKISKKLKNGIRQVAETCSKCKVADTMLVASEVSFSSLDDV